ncbi:MAG: phenylacetate-CoA ligase [Verrucomicrobiales bacterium]|jgi:phenylacetate-CoA ligase
MRDRATIDQLQLTKLRNLIVELQQTNPFYSERMRDARLPAQLMSTKKFVDTMPFTTKAEIIADCLESPPYGTNLTAPIEKYSRFCQSSGTSDGPLPTLDTTASWNGMLDIWELVFDAAEVETSETVFFAFSFGPFLGFWTAFEAATRRGNIAIPGGGMSSVARLQMMARYGAGALCCTPTYAIRLGEVLAEQGADLRDKIKVKRIIVAGEHGGSIPSTRARIESLWPGAQVRDHHGMTEVGPVSFEPADRPFCLQVAEDAFYAEIIDAEGNEVAEGGEGELVLTTLNRNARPLLRYRTGDLVRKGFHKNELIFDGGMLGRIDDMVVIRGVNVYPAAVERIIRENPSVAEFQVVQTKQNAMAQLEVRIELEPESVGDANEVSEQIHVALESAFSLRIPVNVAETGSLPRFEFKSKRWVKPQES